MITNINMGNIQCTVNTGHYSVNSDCNFHLIHYWMQRLIKKRNIVCNYIWYLVYILLGLKQFHVLPLTARIQNEILWLLRMNEWSIRPQLWWQSLPGSYQYCEISVSQSSTADNSSPLQCYNVLRCFLDSLALKMKPLQCFRVSVTIY